MSFNPFTKLLQSDQAWHYRVIPFHGNEDQLHVYCDEDFDIENLTPELELLFNKKIVLESWDVEIMNDLLQEYYPRESGTHQFQQRRLSTTGDRFLYELIAEAQLLKSSDLHIEVYEHHARVRIRVDGMLVERYRLQSEDYPAIVNQIKIMANLDIAEKRMPQDGRLHFRDAAQQFDIRVSVLPTLHGEKVVMRLLNNNAAHIDLDSVGFTIGDLESYLRGIKRPNGIILISGPTGSGKTTTLYATLKYLNKESRNILTIEDPIEYTLQGINQVQLKERIGLSFAAALRTFLRQDPDVIMVGEIRDPETANMAIRAALTGHLVLSTVHTNSAWGIVSRLLDMNIPAFLVASTLNTAVAQRLIRLLCQHCKSSQDFDSSSYPQSFSAPRMVVKQSIAVGCENCHHTGYSGRKAVYEVIPIDSLLCEAIKKGNQSVQSILKEKGIQTLGYHAWELFAAQQTTIEEVYPLLLIEE